MKLLQMREHFHKRGAQWIPKKQYTTEEEALSDPHRLHNQGVFLCSVCNYYHNGRTKNKVNNVK